MRTVSALYRQLWEDPAHIVETKVAVAGAEYSEQQIYSLSVTGGLFGEDTAAIGGCVAREVDLAVETSGAVPRMAEVKVYIRLVLRDPAADTVTAASEWIQKGVFFIDTRSEDSETGIVTLHGYDAMLKAEQVYLSEGDTGEWPRPMEAVAADIAQRMGTTVDARSVFDPAFTVGYPNDYTMREILGFIAAAHAGNWIVTDAGELRLVGLMDIPPETHNLITEHGSAITFGGVRINV